MSSTCAHTRLALGAYILGALDSAERARVDAHLAECAACRDELVVLAPLPGLLSRLGTSGVQVPAAEPALLGRALDRVRRERARARRRQRWSAVAAAVAVAVAVGLGTVAVAPWGDSPPPAPGPATASVAATEPGTNVSATAHLRSKAWGTEVGLRMQGVQPTERCRLVAVGHDGSREIAGSWEATQSGTVVVTNATSIPTTQLRELEVVASDGRTLLTIPVRL